MLERQNRLNFLPEMQFVAVNYSTLLSVTTDPLQPFSMGH